VDIRRPEPTFAVGKRGACLADEPLIVSISEMSDKCRLLPEGDSNCRCFQLRWVDRWLKGILLRLRAVRGWQIGGAYCH
jgi:hypothetical protein